MNKTMKGIKAPVAISAAALLLAVGVYAASTSKFTLTINPGTLAVDIVDGSYNSVAAPTVAFSAVNSNIDCQTGANRSSGTFGTATERIYVQNPDASDSGFTVNLGATSTATWTGTTNPANKFDYNDAAGSGCTDGDTDTYGGQMEVKASAGTLAKGKCVNCDTSNITLGTTSAFTDAKPITLINAAAASSDIGDWTLQGVTLNQTIPAGQASDDYTLDMALTVSAQ